MRLGAALGERVRMNGVIQNITDGKRSQEALRNFTPELKKRSQKRTLERETAGTLLQEAQKLEPLGRHAADIYCRASRTCH